MQPQHLWIPCTQRCFAIVVWQQSEELSNASLCNLTGPFPIWGTKSLNPDWDLFIPSCIWITYGVSYRLLCMAAVMCWWEHEQIPAASVLTAAHTKKQVSISTCSGSIHQCITLFQLNIMQITDFDLATDPCFEWFYECTFLNCIPIAYRVSYV